MQQVESTSGAVNQLGATKPFRLVLVCLVGIDKQKNRIKIEEKI